VDDGRLLAASDGHDSTMTGRADTELLRGRHLSNREVKPG